LTALNFVFSIYFSNFIKIQPFKMKKIIFLIVVLSFSAQAQKVIKTLIVDGQNNHIHWPKITYMLKQNMEETGKFKVDVIRSKFTWMGDEMLQPFAITGMPATESLKKAEPDPNFSPDFSKYDLVICNFGWGAAPWPAATQVNFENYIKKGGGLVVVHAADNSYPKWPAYNEMIGLGGWGDRTEKDGPYVYFDDNGVLQRDMSPGNGGSHGPQREYQVEIRNAEHPITKGMPAKWLHTKDELYDRLRGPAKNMEVLASAYAGKEDKGSGRHEPALMTIKFGKGKIFHTILGHMDYSVECVGFLTTYLRGSQWAAKGSKGKVTIPIPADFPTADKTSFRPFVKK
jgi:uncharacterized protein